LPWVSELQLDAYLEARDALRRARACASLTSCQRPPAPRPSASWTRPSESTCRL